MSLKDTLHRALPLVLFFTGGLATAQQDPEQATPQQISEIRALRERIDQLEQLYGDQSQSTGANSYASTFNASEGQVERIDSSYVTIGALEGVQPVTGEVNFDEVLPEVTAGVDLRFWGRHKFDARIDNFLGAFNLGFQTFIPNAASTGRDLVSFDTRDTRFGFAATHADGKYRTRAVAEIDFFSGFTGPNGSNIEPRLRLGYAEFANTESGYSVRVGQDWLPVASQNPKMLDFGILGLSGNLFWRPPQVTVRKRSGNVEYLASAVMLIDQEPQTQDENMPWFFGRVAFHDAVNEGSMVAVSGGVRHNDVQGSKETSWLGALEWVVPVCESVKVNGELWIGEGLGSEFLRVGLDFNGTTGEAIQATGGFANVEWKVNDKFALNAGYGFDNPSNADLTGGVTPFPVGAARGISFSNNQTVYINGRYAVSKHFGFGAEALHQNTTTAVARQNLEGERVLLSAWFIF